jgi:hypothetical protein
MQGYIPRAITAAVERGLAESPVVAILGPRQCGKSTLAREIAARRGDTIYLDLERPSDLAKLADPETFLEAHEKRLVCLDEIQRAPALFAVLRSLVDARRRGGRFLVLGSSSRDLLRQSSESLAGRIAFHELTPFWCGELGDAGGSRSLSRLWLRGGFPGSYLSRGDGASLRWRESFAATFLERDIPQLGFRIPAGTLSRLWTMLAHLHGQILNSSRLGASLGLSHTTVRSQLDILERTFMVRVLKPLASNTGKRMVKAPKVYLRDTGILHALLRIESHDDLFAHPIRGPSFEGLVIENLVAALPRFEPFFYRTAAGAEIDLVLERGSRRIAVECKASAAPEVGKGFWNALDEVRPDQAWVVAPLKEPYPLRRGVMAAPLGHVVAALAGA